MQGSIFAVAINNVYLCLIVLMITMGSKRKIINDPVFGFITISGHGVLDVLQHPYMQRLSRIKQLGLSSFVYPGAVHTRFLHSIGAMYLMQEAVNQLRKQGQKITTEDGEAAQLAILLHDIGHGPFSHVLENSLVQGVSHEEISGWMMARMNEEFNGLLTRAISVFQNSHQQHFLHQLVSGQLDVDRLDYLCRDSFFCGVNEGTVASARIIKMLNVFEDNLVVEAKGIYSIEKFLVARRLMYWQVYLHKTSVAAEQMLMKILKRAKMLASEGKMLPASEALRFFLYNTVTKKDFNTTEALDRYAMLDDSDIWSALKMWCTHQDKVLSLLCTAFINRNLFKVKILNEPLDVKKVASLKKNYQKQWNLSEEESDYFWGIQSVSTDTYSPSDDRINILYNDGTVKDISDASDMLNINVLTKKVRKDYFYYTRL